MITEVELFFIITIIAGTFAGGYYPIFGHNDQTVAEGLPSGEAFTSGVFIALSLALMLPSATTLLGRYFADLDFPVATFLTAVAFLFLLGIEHLTRHIHKTSNRGTREVSPPVIPVIMTVMIAIPSFFLGTALGISSTLSAFIIWIAIMAHKSSAAFALALKMVRSTLSKQQIILIFTMFALSTPAGIITGEDIHNYLSGSTMMLVKGLVLSLASGTFLYMGTIHDFEHAPMIRSAGKIRGFVIMLAGFLITVFVRFLIGEAHSL